MASWWDDAWNDAGSWWDTSTSAVEDDPLYTDLATAADYAVQLIEADSNWSSRDIQAAEDLVDEATASGGDGQGVVDFWEALADLWTSNWRTDLDAWSDLLDAWKRQGDLTASYWGTVAQYSATSIASGVARDTVEGAQDVADELNPKKSWIPWALAAIGILVLVRK